VRGKTVKLGIQSPETTTIYRQEVLEKIRETNAAARVDADVVKRVLGG
jgi:carbon storage regulator CsrA